MLPPVAAFSDASFDLSGQPGQMQALPRIELSLGHADSAAQAPAPAASDAPRFGLLSLSGQMQLSQGLSVVAETIGALLKINRNAGESLADYSDRIAEAISALSGPEKLALQRALNQLMQGFTLRLLTEILKDPFGPEATRVALQIEAAAYHERDPVTRRIVTSYWQNAGADAAHGPQGPLGPLGPQAAPAGDGRRLRGEWQRPAGSGEGQLFGSSVTPGRRDGVSVLPSPREAAVPQTQNGRQAAAARDNPFGPPALPGSAPQEELPPAAGSPPSATTGRAAAPRQDVAREQDATQQAALDGKAPEPHVGRAPAAALPAGTSETPPTLAGEDATYDGPALARRMAGPDEVMDDAAAPPRPGLSAAGNGPVPVAVAWLSGLYADEGGASWPLAHRLAATAAEPGLTATRPDGAGDAATDPSVTAPRDTPAETRATATTTAGDRAAPAVTSSQTTALPEQAAGQSLSAPSPTAGALRDVAMPAYVPYGPQGMPEDEEMPLVRAVEADDEDREHGRRRGGQDRREAGADDEPPQQDDAAGDGAMEALPVSEEPGPLEADEAPSLSPMPPEDSAQGFYQRLAAW